MNARKLYAFFALTLFAVILASVAVEARLSFETPADLTTASNSTTFALSTNETSATGISLFPLNPIVSRSGASVTFEVSPSSFASITPASPGQVTVLVDSLSGELPFGTYTFTLNATGTEGSSTVSTTVPVTYIKSFCRAGSVGSNLSIQNVDISSSGDEDEEWKLVDRIDVDVEVENEGDNDIDEVQVEIGLFDSDGNNVIDDLDFDSSDEESIDLGNLNDDDSEEVTFSFRVPADFETGSYKLVVKTYSDDSGENRECDDSTSDLDNTLYQAISVEQEDEEERFVIVDEISLPAEATCGETIGGSFEVFNVGDESQDQVRITLQNTELDLDQEFIIREDFDEGDDEQFDFAFEVPNGAQDGTYTLSFRTFYDFDDGVYREESEDDFTASLRVLGCRNLPPSGDASVSIDAELDSDALAGEELVVSSTIRNTGDETTTITVEATGYQSWAELDSISRESFTLAPGQSQTIELVFTVDTDVTGSESFVLEVTADNRLETQEVEVKFAESQPQFNLFQGNAFIWIIVLVNVVLIALIIVVAVRLARK